MFASRSGNIATVGLLLKKGGDSSIVDFDKNTALDYAKNFQHKDVIRILEKSLNKQFKIMKNVSLEDFF